ncbi:MAG: CotH kinase family protein [Oscillospiraceae bacterium]|nr:CotH kinase family protein [Oscillospiraceae bacterium]
MKKSFIIAAAACAVMLVIVVLAVANDSPGYYSHIYINEIMASNKTAVSDSDGDFCDWIEIYNAADTEIDLNGCVISDKNHRWTIKDCVIAPGGFRLIWMSGKDLYGGQLHTSFKIKRAGEQITLFAPDGRFVIDSVDVVSLASDRSYGRVPDGTDDWYTFTDPTPGKSNEESKEILLNMTFSHAGGFYDEQFMLEIKSDSLDAVIYYTLDGQTPSRSSPVYDSPFKIRDRSDEENVYSNIKTGHTWVPPGGNVFKATVVRAKTYDSSGNESDVITHTYFVGENIKDKYALPIISIASDGEGLFGDETGIYVEGRPGDVMGNGNNFRFRGPEWERRASLEFFEPGGQLGFKTDVGLRIHGSGSTVLPLKTLSVYARKRYGDSSIKYPVFGDDPKFAGKEQKFKHLLLKNGDIMLIGTYDLLQHTTFRDELLHELSRDLNICTQAYRPAVVFINGEYWGIQNIREHQDEDYTALNYGADPDKAMFVKLRWGEYKSKNPEAVREYTDFLHYVQTNDLSRPENYDYVKTLADLESFIDYIIAETYVCNTDWIWSNVAAWKTDETGHDGRWRWCLYDTDFGFYLPFADMNQLENAIQGMPYLQSLLENTAFKTRFIIRCADLLNSAFAADRVIEITDQIQKTIAPYIAEHIGRWSMNESFSQWEQNVEDIREFARRRPYAAREHIKNRFHLDGTAELTIRFGGKDEGSVIINTINVEGGGAQWKGIYFRGIPISVTAVPNYGYKFVKWAENGEVSETLSFEMQNDLTLTPEFEKK